MDHCTFADCAKPVFCHELCQRHYGRKARSGFPGCPTCRVNDLGPRQRECTDCLLADFRKYGFEPVDMAAYRNANEKIEATCIDSGELVPLVRLTVLRKFNKHVCEVCYGSERKKIGDTNRRSAEEAVGLAKRAGWTLAPEDFRSGTTQAPATCDGCGAPHPTGGILINDIRSKLDEGVRLYGCMKCVRRRYGAQGFLSVARLERRPDLAVIPSLLYLVEFEDVDGTVFHKFGIATWGDPYGRLYRHGLDKGVLLGSLRGDRITCAYAEALIREYVWKRAYRPSKDRLSRGGDTECFLPDHGERLDLERWLERGRLLAGGIRVYDAGKLAWERPPFVPAPHKNTAAIPSYLKHLEKLHGQLLDAASEVGDAEVVISQRRLSQSVRTRGRGSRSPHASCRPTA